MTHPTTNKRAWRLLVLDPSHDDPMWVVATVVELADVRPASPADTALGELTTRWVASRAGLARVELTKLAHASVWRVDGSPDGLPAPSHLPQLPGRRAAAQRLG
jgi:hypothetical protein